MKIKTAIVFPPPLGIGDIIFMSVGIQHIYIDHIDHEVTLYSNSSVILKRDKINYKPFILENIIKANNIGHKECIHNILWQCKFGGIFRPNNFNFQTKGIMAIHKGHINRNIYNTCSCEHERQELDNEYTFTYFTEKYHHIYPHSILLKVVLK